MTLATHRLVLAVTAVVGWVGVVAPPATAAPEPDPPAREPAPPAFQLHLQIDLPVLTVGLAFVGARFVQTRKAFCAPLCDPGDLNALDRTTAGTWRPGWRLASNVGVVALGVGVAALLVADEGLARAANDAVVIGEAALTATAVATIMTVAVGRPRPFLYGDQAPLSDRNDSDAANSFLSSHAAIGFAVASSTFIAARRLHPGSRLSHAILGIGLGAAGFVASARVLAGQHFITDAVGGALVGSSVGVLVATLHGSPVSVAPVLGQDHQGIGLHGSF